jgi:hypothetical protein
MSIASIAGTPLLITMTFASAIETESGPAGTPVDPTDGTLVLQPNGGEAISVPFDEWVSVMEGTFTYEFDTTGLPGAYTAQAQGIGAWLAVTDPYYFQVDAPILPGLT